jgi:hypothetical protein
LPLKIRQNTNGTNPKESSYYFPRITFVQWVCFYSMHPLTILMRKNNWYCRLLIEWPVIKVKNCKLWIINYKSRILRTVLIESILDISIAITKLNQWHHTRQLHCLHNHQIFFCPTATKTHKHQQTIFVKSPVTKTEAIIDIVP